MNEDIETFSGALLGAIIGFWESILNFMPKVVATALLLVLGVLLARFSKLLVERTLHLFKFDNLVQKTGLESYIAGTEYEIKISGLISGTIYWLIILLSVSTVAELLGLKIISDLFARIVVYLPNVILALVILIVGTIFARIVNRYVFSNVKPFSLDLALTASVFCEVIVQVFIWFLALEQLQVNTTLLLIIISIVFGSIALACALAFGIAGQELARELLSKARDRIEGGIDDD